MNYETWVGEVSEEIRGDSLWKAEAYRLGLFAADVGWRDVTKLFQDGRTRSLADQLYRALGSVSANVAEGYSRGSSKTPPLNPPRARRGSPHTHRAKASDHPYFRGGSRHSRESGNPAPSPCQGEGWGEGGWRRLPLTLSLSPVGRGNTLLAALA